MNRTTQTNSIISVIAYGAHRLTEICGRLQKTATNLSRPLANLKDLGYLTREIPFGEQKKSTKKTLYKIADPYLQFWYRFVFPHLSLLEVDRVDEVYGMIMEHLGLHVAAVWEELARKSCAYDNIANIAWNPGTRWWGKGYDGQVMEIDVIAESLDKKSLLVGEVKWREQINIDEVLFLLQQKIKNLPLCAKYQYIVLAIWAKHSVDTTACQVITPERLCKVLS
jgi:AAA+ ATPase superfamily predicted ATPase